MGLGGQALTPGVCGNAEVEVQKQGIGCFTVESFLQIQSDPNHHWGT